mgnify:FL=1
MATPTYIPLAEVTLAASSSVVHFTEISQDYSDLFIAVEIVSTSNTSVRLNLNGSFTDYYKVVMRGSGSSATSYASSTAEDSFTLQGTSGSTGAVSLISLMDYSSTDKHKVALIRGNCAATRVEAGAYRWANNSAITSLSFHTNTAYEAGCTFKLFGIHGEVV